tara:strand:- start:28 stop:906 length:879 start_codon:yes stop_codon:yes gene_type:complete
MNRLEKIKTRLKGWDSHEKRTKGCSMQYCPACKELIPSDFISKKDGNCVLCEIDGRHEVDDYRHDFPMRIGARLLQLGIRSCYGCKDLHLKEDLSNVRNDYTFENNERNEHYDEFCSDCRGDIKHISEFENWMWTKRAEIRDFTDCAGIMIDEVRGIVKEKYLSVDGKVIFVGESIMVKVKDNKFTIGNNECSMCDWCERVFSVKKVSTLSLLDSDKASRGIRKEYDYDLCCECHSKLLPIKEREEDAIESIIKEKKKESNERARAKRCEKKAEELFFAGLALGGEIKGEEK